MCETEGCRVMRRQGQERQQQQQTDASSGHDTITHADLLNHMAMMNETTGNQLSRVLDARLEPMAQALQEERADNRSRFRWIVGLVIGVGIGVGFGLAGLMVALANAID